MKEENLIPEYLRGKRYFKVTCKCGHVGKKQYIPITFAIYAENGKEAAEKARNYPRVKHQHKDAILDVEEVNYEEFSKTLDKNRKDPYLISTSKQKQEALCENFECRIVEDPHHVCEEKDEILESDRTYKIKRNKESKNYKWEDEYYLELIDMDIDFSLI